MNGYFGDSARNCTTSGEIDLVTARGHPNLAQYYASRLSFPESLLLNTYIKPRDRIVGLRSAGQIRHLE
ncbi:MULTISPECIES: hypothetical protein [unclassified Bradyrhizobium]|uniref:hypothetical protein n=1 Tax=unclassified Bradyrhizobium TaxID=2631580 RepID=UPI001CD5510D|nr:MULTISPECIES: hypothetical protein [unclassified Bradyrhizobium]MCA1364941.1 hypothetical protein [Bradyrhizobium sp. IC4059]MCA1383481.1 hypothetical protein [Bradyrhizobium sp. BRP05]MCA1420336.1 hypothetical protein [Bradyrhizobium sp. BRP23]MCA1435944.1 hypothetical protein [Bradyrhizobium sp. BRP20]